tara:strand:+ start:47136 stop:50717 length:3582 start_codon:yes stop_codon:yes gene_type:complete
MQRKIKKGIKFLYFSISLLIIATCLLYLLLIFVLEYLSYHPEYVEDFVHNNINVTKIKQIKLKRRAHSLNINIYDLNLDKKIHVPKIEFKLNLVKSIFFQELVFDSMSISQAKINLNESSSVVNLFQLPKIIDSNNKENLDKILSNDNLNLYLNKGAQLLRQNIKKYKFIRNISISDTEFLIDSYKIHFNNIKIRTYLHKGYYNFKLRSWAHILHDNIKNNHVIIAANFRTSKHDSKVFTGTAFGHVKHLNMSNLEIFDNKYTGKITSASSLLEIKHNQLKKIKLDLDVDNLNNLKYKISNFKLYSVYLPKKELIFKKVDLDIQNKLTGDFYYINKANVKLNFENNENKLNKKFSDDLISSDYLVKIKGIKFFKKNTFKKPLDFNKILVHFNTFDSSDLNQINLNFSKFSGSYDNFSFNLKGAVFLPYKELKNNVFFDKIIDYKKSSFSLLTNLKQLPAAEIINYLPIYKLDKDIVKWVNDSFLSGNISNIDIIFRGGFNNDFPYDFKEDKSSKGQFIANITLDKFKLEYIKDWPVIDKLSGQIVFNTRDMDFVIEKGSIYSSSIENSIGHIKNIRKNYPNILHIDGIIKGPSQNIIKYLQNIDCKECSKDFLDNSSFSGDSLLKLSIKETLGTKIPTEISGKVSLQNAALQLKHKTKDSLFVNHIFGDINFNNDILSSNSIKLSWLDNVFDVKFNVKEDKLNNYMGDIQYSSLLSKNFFEQIINLYGQPESKFLNNYFKSMQGSSLFKGNVDFILQQDKITSLKFGLSSDLKGIASSIKYPFEKKSQDTKKFNITLNTNNLKSFNQVKVGQSNFKINYGNIKIFLNENSLSKDVYGKVILSDFSLHDIVNLHKFITENINNNKQINKNYFIKVYINNGTYNKDFKLVGTIVKKIIKNNVELSFNLDSLEFFDTAEKLYSSIQEIINISNIEKHHSKEISNNNIDLNFKIIIKKLYLNNYLLGSLVGDMSKNNANFKLNGKNVDFEVRKKSNSLSGGISFDNLGKLLSSLNIEQYINKARGYLSFNLDNIDSDDPKGSFFILLKDGEIKKVDPGIGRLLGAFSFSSLQRKIKLDFSDITDRSYAFDQVIGNFTLDNHKILAKDVKISGPSADIELSGDLNIRKNYYTLLADVTPKISGGVPVAAAIVSGNPAVGIIVWAVDKLLQSPFDKMSRSRYVITGTSSNPEINKIKIG